MNRSIYACHVTKDSQRQIMITLWLPYHGRYPNVKAGTDFLKSLQEMPQFVCTCCHCMLFNKTVKPFNITEYDMNNDIMQNCLSHHYRMTLQKSAPAVKVWKLSMMNVEDRKSEANNTYIQ